MTSELVSPEVRTEVSVRRPTLPTEATGEGPPRLSPHREHSSPPSLSLSFLLFLMGTLPIGFRAYTDNQR